MTIFRHKNGKLYTLEMVRLIRYTCGPQLVATPYRHTEPVKRPKMSHFTAIAEC